MLHCVSNAASRTAGGVDDRPSGRPQLRRKGSGMPPEAGYPGSDRGRGFMRSGVAITRAHVFVGNLPHGFVRMSGWCRGVSDAVRDRLERRRRRDPVTGAKLRYGFVDIATEKAAKAGDRRGLNGTQLGGSKLLVQLSEKPAKKPRVRPASQGAPSAQFVAHHAAARMTAHAPATTRTSFQRWRGSQPSLSRSSAVRCARSRRPAPHALCAPAQRRKRIVLT